MIPLHCCMSQSPLGSHDPTALSHVTVPRGSHDPTALSHVTVPRGSHDPTALSHVTVPRGSHDLTALSNDVICSTHMHSFSRGAARRLPTSVIELVKTVNRSLKLGQLLCRCRSPDFLLDIIKRQVMGWYRKCTYTCVPRCGDMSV